MDADKQVWVPDNIDGFIKGKIVDIGADTISVNANGKIISASYDSVYPAEDDENKDVNDNCALMYLNQATLLNNLRKRYKKDIIYSYVANILIAVNPYRKLPDLYSTQTIQSYQGKSLGTRPPHVFAIADKSYRDMITSGLSQSIIVSGESGAGKTESTKYILKYLTESWGSHAGPIEQRIIESNPLLEAFGNAKTMRNNNSSRFGKFVEIHMNNQYKVCGAYISHYLLEKSRICRQSSQERNYHIFYRLCAGAPDALRRDIGLTSPIDYNYLNRGCTKIFEAKGNSNSSVVMDDVKDFKITDQAMKSMGMDENEIRSIYTIVASVLHLGNISFEDDLNNKKGEGGCAVSKSSMKALNSAATLLGVDAQDLESSLISRVMQTQKAGVKGTIIKVPLKIGEANSARDAFAKSIYAKLFDYIVTRVNNSLPFSQSKAYIGVLDIAGFEYFQHNSFEQFCINYCNEKMQQFFNQRILKEEQQLYAKEGLNVKQIDYIDNQDCLDLIESKTIGIFSLLDEEAKLPQSSCKHFTADVHQKNSKHYRLCIPRKSKWKAHREIRDDEGFLVRHYAGAVCYQTEEFLEKNNDALHTSLEILLQESENTLVKIISKEKEEPSNGKNSKSVMKQMSSYKGSGKLTFSSVGSKFRSQLMNLMEKLQTTGTSFIRCMKPNLKMIDKDFEGAQILAQLECSGMTTVLDLMQQGYPSRTSFHDLYQMYQKFMPKDLARLDPRMFVKALFKALGLNDNDFKFGLTKVFFRPGKFAEFDQIMKSDPENLALLIKKVKKWLIGARWKKAIYGTISVIKLKNKIIYRKQNLSIIQNVLLSWSVRRQYLPRIKGMAAIGHLKNQLTPMRETIKQLKKEKDSAKKKVDSLEKNMLESMKKLQTTKLQQKNISKIQETIMKDVDKTFSELQKLIEKQKIHEEAERMRIIQEQLEKEKQRKFEEELQKNKDEQERKIKIEMEIKRKKDVEAQRKFEEAERKQASANAKKLEKENMENQIKNQQLEQEKRDRELALRLASEDQSQVEDISTESKAIKISGNKKHDLSKWKYAELRDTINTSCDFELLNACKEEFHRRLKVYHSWKTKNKKRNDVPDVNDVTRVPVEKTSVVTSSPTKTSEANQQRFFRIPFVRPASVGGDVQSRKGWWFAHFDGRWIARQMELHPDNATNTVNAILLVAGVDDMKMCELSLDETGLTRKKGAEIMPNDFEIEWNKHGGNTYLVDIKNQVSSKFLKEMLLKN